MQDENNVTKETISIVKHSWVVILKHSNMSFLKFIKKTLVFKEKYLDIFQGI